MEEKKKGNGGLIILIVIGIVMFLKKEIHYVLLENKNVIVKTCTGKHILLT